MDNTGFEPVTFHKAHLEEMRSENHTPRPIALVVGLSALFVVGRSGGNGDNMGGVERVGTWLDGLVLWVTNKENM